MKISFKIWSADELAKSYIEFIKKKKSKEIFIKYHSKENGFTESMEGHLETSSKKLKELPEKIRLNTGKQTIELTQKTWKAEFKLSINSNPDNEYINNAELIFDETLKKEIYNHFKEFSPK